MPCYKKVRVRNVWKPVEDDLGRSEEGSISCDVAEHCRWRIFLKEIKAEKKIYLFIHLNQATIGP